MLIAVPTRSVPLRGTPHHHRIRPALGQTSTAASSMACSTSCVTPQCSPVPAGGCPAGYTAPMQYTSESQCAAAACSEGQCLNVNTGQPGSPTGSVSKETGAVVSAASSITASLLALSPATGPAAPFVAIAGALASFVTGVLGIGKGCGESCITATEFANYFGCLIQVNLYTYLSLPVPRTTAQQAAALTVYDAAWQYLVQACGTVSGSAGQNCVSDRAAGGKYDSTGYRAVIANDPCVCSDPTPVDSVTGAATTAEGAVSSAVAAVSSATGLSTSIVTPLLLVAGLLLLARAL